MRRSWSIVPRPSGGTSIPWLFPADLELRCGMSSPGEKLIDRLRPTEVACFLPPYLAEVCRRQTTWPVNDPRSLSGADLLVVNTRVKAHGLPQLDKGPSRMFLDAHGTVLAAYRPRRPREVQHQDSIDALLALGEAESPPGPGRRTADVELSLGTDPRQPGQLAEDFRTAGRSGIEGQVEEPSAIRGSRSDIFIGRGTTIHPLVVLDAEHGPIYIDEDVQVHPFTRIEGPATSAASRPARHEVPRGELHRAHVPHRRRGGRVDHPGLLNKYHDGFLGHAYVGQWVNLAPYDQQRPQERLLGVKITLDGRAQLRPARPRSGP